MGRFRPRDEASKDVDEDIRALMEDIDASVADLDRRLEEEAKRQARPARSRPPADDPLPELPLPPIAPPRVAAPVREEPPSEPAHMAVPRSSPAMHGAAPGTGSLLDELAHEANAKAGTTALSELERQRRARRNHEALDRVARYFDVFCRHTNTLAPAIARSYRLDDKTIFTDLHWRDAVVKARKDSLSESALYDFVALRVRLAAPSPITMKIRNDKAAAFKRDMHVLDLRLAEGMELDGIRDPSGTTLRLAPDFPVQMTFAGNCESDRVDIVCRNLENFGISAFTCSPEEIDQALLDGIGRYLLARSHQLPAALRRAHYRNQL
ncbi:MAG TPA: hypothetical protein VMC81_09340 [Rhodocyclaceae bacterium]|nr:hypothetical protein [Rhodocyclaceae bacterium]